jgi:pantoate--beta-alanine ligase
LFNLAGPCRAYFGEKDFQQVAVIRRMVEDLSFPVEVVGCPTVRAADGLAMSSRNVHLSPSQRTQAAVVPAALADVVAAYRSGERSTAELCELARARIAGSADGVLDYVAVVDADTLEPIEVADDGSRVLLAVRFGSIRLLDNASVLDRTLSDPPPSAPTGPDAGGAST